MECVDSVGKASLWQEKISSISKVTKIKLRKGYNYPKLAEILEVQFCKGDTKMFWKTLFDESEYESSEFLQKNFVSNVKRKFRVKRKVLQEEKEKKNGCCTKNGKMMPKNCCLFWECLPADGNSDVLSINYENLSKE